MNKTNFKKIEELTSINISYVKALTENVEEIKNILTNAHTMGKMTEAQQNLIIPQSQVFNEVLKKLFKTCTKD